MVETNLHRHTTDSHRRRLTNTSDRADDVGCTVTTKLEGHTCCCTHAVWVGASARAIPLTTSTLELVPVLYH